MRIAKKVRIFLSTIVMGIILLGKITASASGTDISLWTLPDYDKKGSITVDIVSSDTGKAISGGTLTLYAVGKLVDGENFFEATAEFEKCNIDFNDVDKGSKELAASLENYVNNNKMAGKSVSVDENGQTQWLDLDLGLYLIVQSETANGYISVDSFLVTVPGYLNGVYVYDVQAKPKVGTKSTSVGQPTVSEPAPSVPDGKLPQTGQLWWPVPFLSFTGMIFVIFGWYRRCHFGKFDKESGQGE